MEKLRNLREDAELTQEDIANILGIHRSTYTSYEIERDTMPINHLNTLCNYFNVSIDYVLGFNTKMQYPHNRKNIDKKLLTSRLKDFRKNNHLTQKQIAEIFKISRSTWTGYEYGHYQIPTLILFTIAKDYHVSIDYLLGKIDEY